MAGLGWSHLDLLDIVLDPLDGVSVDVVPRMHLFLSDHLCSDHCKRGKTRKSGQVYIFTPKYKLNLLEE